MTPEKLIDTCCEAWGVRREVLTAPGHSGRNAAYMRRAVIVLCRAYTNATTKHVQIALGYSRDSKSSSYRDTLENLSKDGYPGRGGICEYVSFGAKALARAGIKPGWRLDAACLVWHLCDEYDDAAREVP